MPATLRSTQLSSAAEDKTTPPHWNLSAVTQAAWLVKCAAYVPAQDTNYRTLHLNGTVTSSKGLFVVLSPQHGWLHHYDLIPEGSFMEGTPLTSDYFVTLMAECVTNGALTIDSLGLDAAGLAAAAARPEFKAHIADPSVLRTSLDMAVSPPPKQCIRDGNHRFPPPGPE